MKKLLAILIVTVLCTNTALAALGDNLASYWKMDESSGNAADSVGSYTLSNHSITYAAGKINNGAVFSGSSAYLDVASDLGVASNSSFSVSMWIKPSSDPASGAFRQLYSWSRNSTNDFFSSLMYWKNASTQQIQIYFEGATSVEDYYNSSLTQGNWYHIVLSVTYGSGYVLYINGTSVKTGSCPNQGSGFSAASFMTLGQTKVSGGTVYDRYFQGTMDEVSVYSRALTGDEVTALYNSGNGLQYPYASAVIFTPDIIFFE